MDEILEAAGIFLEVIELLRDTMAEHLHARLDRGVGLAATASLPHGVALIDAASGDQISVQFLGGTTVKATLLAGPVTVGDTVFSVASGQVAITGTVTVGKSLTTASDAGAIIEMLPKNF